MKLKDEADVVRRYSTKYDRAFYRYLSASLEWADETDISAIKNTFPEWWLRCITNTELLKERGVPL